MTDRNDIFDDITDIAETGGMERTTRTVAKEIARKFWSDYDFRDPRMMRTESEAADLRAKFVQVYPTARDFVRGHAHQADGSILVGKPNWQHFVQAARQRMVQMLGDSGISDALKKGIYDAIIEDRARQDAHKIGGDYVRQRMLS